jgi:hypothetical protein
MRTGARWQRRRWVVERIDGRPAAIEGIKTMDARVRRVLDEALERVQGADITPAVFAGNYAFCLGILMGGCACGGVSESEAAEERAHLMTLATLYEVRQKVRLSLPN